MDYADGKSLLHFENEISLDAYSWKLLNFSFYWAYANNQGYYSHLFHTIGGDLADMIKK